MESFRSQFRRLLAEAQSLDVVLLAACREIRRRIPGARVAALVLNHRQLVPCAATDGFDREFIGAMTSAFRGIAPTPWQLALDRRRTVIIDDIAADSRCLALREPARRRDVHGGWFVPVVAPSGDATGLLAVLLRSPRRPRSPQRASLRRVADLCAVAIRREQLHAESHRAEGRLKSLMANVPGIVLQWSIAPGGSIALPFLSDSAEAIAGARVEDLTRRPRLAFGRVARNDRRRLIGALRRSARRLEPLAEDFRIDCRAKGIRWFRLTSMPQAMADGSVVSDALCLDINESRIADETLRRNQAELNERLLELHRTKARLEAQSTVLVETARELTEARDAAEQASRAKSEFLSNMSHELRTPLNAIIGFSEVIREQTFGPVGSPKYRDYASDIYISGQHLLELINDILDFTKIEAGREELHVETLDIRGLVEDVLRIVHDRAERAGLHVGVEIPDDLPSLVGDRRKITRVLLNLLSNAIKFTQPGGRLTVTAWCSNAGFVMQIADTGIGIALEDIPKALGLFGQIDNAFSRRHEGTGLGLPLSKALVEMHGGSLDLQSHPGVGTTATIRLPAERVLRDGPVAAVARTG